MSSDRERGFALIAALVLTFLFFSLVALLMIESTALLRSAQHFRSRIVAQNLAESGAELAARSMSIRGSSTISTEVDEGTIAGEYRLTAGDSPGVNRFIITGTGTTNGSDPMTATVKLYGIFAGGGVRVEQTEHSQ